MHEKNIDQSNKSKAAGISAIDLGNYKVLGLYYFHLHFSKHLNWFYKRPKWVYATSVLLKQAIILPKHYIKRFTSIAFPNLRGNPCGNTGRKKKSLRWKKKILDELLKKLQNQGFTFRYAHRIVKRDRSLEEKPVAVWMSPSASTGATDLSRSTGSGFY